MHDKEVEKALEAIKNNMTGIVRDDFVMLFGWLQKLDERVTRLEKRKNSLRQNIYTALNFLFQFGMMIAMLIMLYLLTRKT